MSPEAKGQTIGKDAKDMQELNLTVSSSPHVRCNESIPKIMWNVVAALVPAAASAALVHPFLIAIAAPLI